jgi:hypothetical protein
MIGARRGEGRRILMGKREGNRRLRRQRYRLVGNIKIDLRKIEWGGVEWIDLALGRDH